MPLWIIYIYLQDNTLEKLIHKNIRQAQHTKHFLANFIEIHLMIFLSSSDSCKKTFCSF